MTSPNPYFLSSGSHRTADSGRCAMEWVSYLAGERHSDTPACVSPVLRSFCIRFNDRLGDEERQRLRPYLARTIGTRGDGMDGHRIQLCREFLLRRALPLYLDAAGREQAAQHLRSLPDALTLEATLEAIRFARTEARDARFKAEARLTEHARTEMPTWSAATAAVDAHVTLAVADVALAASAVDAGVAAAELAATGLDAGVPSLPLGSELRQIVYEKAQERTRAFNEQLTPAAFDLLDRMLPLEPLVVPVAPDAELVCASPTPELVS